MKVNRTIGIILIISSLGLGYIGINKISNSQTSIEVLNIEMEATNKVDKRQGYIYTSLALVVFIGGIYVLRK